MFTVDNFEGQADMLSPPAAEVVRVLIKITYGSLTDKGAGIGGCIHESLLAGLDECFCLVGTNLCRSLWKLGTRRFQKWKVGC